jgi:hypothetical protein
VHGQSVLRHGQSFARNSRFQRTLGGSARTGHGFHLSMFRTSPLGLRANSRVRPTRKERRLDDRRRSEQGIGPRGPSRSACPCSPCSRLSTVFRFDRHRRWQTHDGPFSGEPRGCSISSTVCSSAHQAVMIGRRTLVQRRTPLGESSFRPR